MRDTEILDEIEANARELIELGATAGNIPDWDLNVAVVGAGLTIGGMVLTGPLSLVGLALGGAGLAVIGVDMARKMSTLRTAAAVVLRSDALRIRNARLRNELQTRYR